MEKYLDIKNFSCKKRLMGKLLFACEDEIINALETLLHDDKYHVGKITALILLFLWELYTFYYYLSF